MPLFVRRLFLVDGLGALLSAFFLGVILVLFEDYFGMPKRILYVLSFLACTYAIYSLACYFFLTTPWRPYLNAIAFANLLHCCLTIGLIIDVYPKLTILGLTYFLLELCIVGSLIVVELKTSRFSLK